MKIEDITVLILTLNESANIRRTLNALTWARNILVVDSGSVDETVEIIKEFRNTKIVVRNFDSFAKQCNFGLSIIETAWVLSIDADYIVPNSFSIEIESMHVHSDVVGLSATFSYAIHGINIGGSLYPPRCVLYRRSGARYIDEGHGHRLSITGKVQALRSRICHDDRKELSRWFGSQINYARREAEYLIAAPRANLSVVDRLRLLGWFTPMVVFFYALLWKGCIFSGYAGWHYVMQRTLAETAIALEVIDRRIIARMQNKL